MNREARALRAGETMGDRGFRWLTTSVAALMCLTFALLILVLIQRSMPSIEAFGFGFLWGREWDPAGGRFGALPYIFGTAATSLLALIFAVPVAVGAAIAFTELLPRRVAGPLSILVELLAAVPSIVYGVWGIYVIVPFVRRIGPEGTTGSSMLAAGLVLAVMILPIITAVTREIIRAVPRSQREAALALGLTPWEVVWRVVLPHARGGTIAAVILGLGRAWGETMAVILVIGTQPLLHLDPFKPAYTIASLIANQFGDPSGPLHAASLVELGLILLLVSFALNLVSTWIIARTRRRLQGAFG